MNFANFVGGIDAAVVSGFKHNCCDICTLQCECLAIIMSLCRTTTEIQGDDEDEKAEPEAICVVTEIEKDLLHVCLINFSDESSMLPAKTVDINWI